MAILKNIIPQEKGQAIVEFALILPIMIMLLGFAVDVGFWTFQMTRLQGAANSAAMAGAAVLPDTEAAEARALEYAEKNGFTEGVTTEITEQEITVTIEQEAYIFFTGIFTTEARTFTGQAVYAGIH